MSSSTRADNDESACEKSANDFRARLRSEAPQYSVPRDEEFLRRLKARLQVGDQAELAEIFASAGRKATAAHVATADDINAFSAQATATLDCFNTLYNNIRFPLSATVCHSPSLPSDTLASHLANLQEHIASAVNTLNRLNEEWHSCLQEQRAIFAAINTPSKQIDTTSLQKEVDDIIRQSEHKIDAVEKMQAETMKVMQAMMDE